MPEGAACSAVQPRSARYTHATTSDQARAVLGPATTLGHHESCSVGCDRRLPRAIARDAHMAHGACRKHVARCRGDVADVSRDVAEVS